MWATVSSCWCWAGTGGLPASRWGGWREWGDVRQMPGCHVPRVVRWRRWLHNWFWAGTGASPASRWGYAIQAWGNTCRMPRAAAANAAHAGQGQPQLPIPPLPTHYDSLRRLFSSPLPLPACGTARCLSRRWCARYTCRRRACGCATTRVLTGTCSWHSAWRWSGSGGRRQGRPGPGQREEG